jgi:septal ring-binding cell division protein DamX
MPPETTSATPLLDRLAEQSRAWLDTAPDDRWFIQLFTAIDADNPAQVESFLANVRTAGLEMAQVRVYRLIVDGKPRYGILYGDYASRQDALKALNTLPPEVKRYRPYVRQAVRLRLDGKAANKG